MLARATDMQKITLDVVDYGTREVLGSACIYESDRIASLKRLIGYEGALLARDCMPPHNG